MKRAIVTYEDGRFSFDLRAISDAFMHVDYPEHFDEAGNRLPFHPADKAELGVVMDPADIDEAEVTQAEVAARRAELAKKARPSRRDRKAARNQPAAGIALPEASEGPSAGSGGDA